MSAADRNSNRLKIVKKSDFDELESPHEGTHSRWDVADTFRRRLEKEKALKIQENRKRKYRNRDAA